MWPLYNPNKKPKERFQPTEELLDYTLKNGLTLTLNDSRWCKVDLDFYLNKEGCEEAKKRIEDKRTRTIELDNRYEDLA